LTTEFSFGFGAETSVISSISAQNQDSSSQEKTVDSEAALELRTRHDGVQDDMILAADITPATEI
jgi:hypothetical protein